MPEPLTYSAEEVDAAVAALSEPERLQRAQEVLTHAAPSLHRVLNQALDEGGWFGAALDAQLVQATRHDDPAERLDAVRALLAEETRLVMLVGATAGFELARELARRRAGEAAEGGPGEH